MRLAVPLGLLGLIAVAVLILIYIFKPKYQDKKFSSTYIWKLSLKYAKRKVPLQWLQNSLLFIVQLLILALIAFSMSFPQVVLDSKNGEKIIVIDASASMSAVYDGKSRFDAAKDEIIDIIDETTGNSHKVSVIVADGKSSFIIRRTDSASYAKQKLFETECGMSEADVGSAMELAEDVLAENPSAEVLFYTDHDYKDKGKVTVINVANAEWNAAILDFSAKRVKGKYVFTAEVASYGKAAEFSVKLSIDGKAQLPGLAKCGKNATAKVVWDSLDISKYDSAEVHLSASDSASFDNDFYIYAPNTELIGAQLVSDNPGFLNSALRSNEKCRVVIPNETVPETDSGFDLYIYDGKVPQNAPSDGSVWYVNPTEDIPLSSGITVGAVRGDGKDDRLPLTAASASPTAKAILKSVNPANITLSRYTRITRYTGYEPILLVDGDPVLLIKDDNGIKTVVLAFDLHMANFPIVADFPLLINNLCTVSVPKTVDSTLYEVGDEIEIRAKAGATSLTVSAEYGDGTSQKSTYNEYPVRLSAEKSGVYKISQETLSGRNSETEFYVRVAESESVFGNKLDVLENPITPFGSGTDTSIKNNTEDITFYFIIAILVLLCVEWGLQYREQY